ncbi:hypothetical protein J4Q44_G00334580 [Coregonus suidteri]|uniref:ubiquitinyl hydrolase 1 n=1 Tax=Coregonus suidteri TaxID=861788 RepID=A0AAN8Q8Y2_9TELE
MPSISISHTTAYRLPKNGRPLLSRCFEGRERAESSGLVWLGAGVPTFVVSSGNTHNSGIDCLHNSLPLPTRPLTKTADTNTEFAKLLSRPCGRSSESSEARSGPYRVFKTQIQEIDIAPQISLGIQASNSNVPVLSLSVPFCTCASPTVRRPQRFLRFLLGRVLHKGVDAVYNLYVQSLRHDHGRHYTAYCRNPTSGEWYTFNDSRVTPMSSSQVRSSDAYVLFYELASSSRM